LLLFISFEKGDVEKKVEIIDKAVNEIQTIASQLKVNPARRKSPFAR